MPKKTPTRKSVRVFYSWQSDLPDPVNAQLIRSALSTAATNLSEDEDLQAKVYVDEATRGLAGSPNIAHAILAKIEQADMFVCDITKVAEFKSEEGEIRKCCNPNVAIELGYAIHELGWDRVILVFNTAYGRLPIDLPFDVQGHRTSRYRCKAEFMAGKLSAESNTNIANAKGLLRGQLSEALRTVIVKSSKRPAELKEHSPEAIKRAQDVQQLNDVFYWIHLRVIDQFFDRVAYGRLTDASVEFYRHLAGVVDSTEFHFHNPELEALTLGFVRAWSGCFKYVDCMEYNPHRNDHYFRMPMDIPESPEQGKQYRYMMAQRRPTREALDALLRYVRNHYLEINPNECGREAWKNYKKHEKLPF